MNALPCLNSSRRALYRVFVTPTTHHEAALQHQMLHLARARTCVNALAPLTQIPTKSQTQTQTRAYAKWRPNPRGPQPETLQPNADELGYDPRYTTQDAVEKSGRGRLPRDHEIKDPRIMVLQDGVFEGPHATRTVMARLDQDTHSLRMIKAFVPARAKDGVPAEFAICSVVNKRDEYQREREVRARKKLSAVAKSKEVELNWGIGEHDLATKMRQMVAFLEKGSKVELVFGRKKGNKKVEDQAAAELLVKVRELLAEAGAREHKPEDGEVNVSLRLYIEGKATK